MENSSDTTADHSNPSRMDTTATVNVKTPKRVLHFSDGTLEEFSDDAEDSPTVHQQEVNKSADLTVDPKTLDWMPWISHKLWAAGSSTLSACDYVGESLASTFGITTPKYYFEIEEFKRREAEKLKLEAEKIGWSENANPNAHLVVATQEYKDSVTTSL